MTDFSQVSVVNLSLGSTSVSDAYKAFNQAGTARVFIETGEDKTLSYTDYYWVFWFIFGCKNNTRAVSHEAAHFFCLWNHVNRKADDSFLLFPAL